MTSYPVFSLAIFKMTVVLLHERENLYRGHLLASPQSIWAAAPILGGLCSADPTPIPQPTPLLT